MLNEGSRLWRIFERLNKDDEARELCQDLHALIATVDTFLHSEIIPGMMKRIVLTEIFDILEYKYNYVQHPRHPAKQRPPRS